jgi:hypothetical protein
VVFVAKPVVQDHRSKYVGRCRRRGSKVHLQIVEKTLLITCPPPTPGVPGGLCSDLGVCDDLQTPGDLEGGVIRSALGSNDYFEYHVLWLLTLAIDTLRGYTYRTRKNNLLGRRTNVT